MWQWENLAGELQAAEHTEYGTLTLAAPDGGHEIVPGTSMTFQAVRPGDRTTPHSHSWWHLYFVRSGSGAVVFDETGDTAALSEGDILLIPAWSVHHFENGGVGNDGSQNGAFKNGAFENGAFKNGGTADDLLLLNMSNLPQLALLDNKFSKEHERTEDHE
ncbi:cupin domain-containing protein [Streptomyces sp. NPDC088116]|uniref:cupin domain-containing protein n=1 Tax=Streptomyces sp. NPDC088116 TaxID=3365825 RepID=UPI0037F71F5F